MMEIILKISPIIFIFVLGYILKKTNLLKKRDADLFLKVVFYISLPALIILSVSNITLSKELIYLPIIAPVIVFITFFISYIFGRLLNLEKTTLGVFLVGSMIMNIGFTLPFVIAAYGEEGLARISLFDFGNTIVVLIFVYYVAVKYGDGVKSTKAMFRKLLSSMPIWALILAIIFNLGGVQIPVIVDNFLRPLGTLLTPLLMMSIGIYFNPRIKKFVPVVSAVIIRSLFGLLLGFLLVKVFSFEGLNRLVVLIASAAPVGFNTLTFTSLEKLDKEFAATLVSVSILLGIVFIPILIAFLA